jgi:hypothetical protein
MNAARFQANGWAFAASPPFQLELACQLAVLGAIFHADKDLMLSTPIPA